MLKCKLERRVGLASKKRSGGKFNNDSIALIVVRVAVAVSA